MQVLSQASFHAADGLVIAQEPTEAGYSGMPDSAIQTGFVAQTLRMDQMVAALGRFWKQHRSIRCQRPTHREARKTLLCGRMVPARPPLMIWLRFWASLGAGRICLCRGCVHRNQSLKLAR